MLNETMQHKTNRLANEKSPYLLQHAHNPVDWYPWGEEAFEKAKSEDKPVFLSIGYSTCHWCHVMAHESFEDEEVARLLSEQFIAIKVDREERPDVDHIYMEVCQTLTGSGGWPLTIFMTADKRPFYAGTYFPKRDRMGMPGMMTLIGSITDYWLHRRDELLESSEKILEVMQRSENRSGGYRLDESVLHGAFKQYRQSFDGVFGGFHKAPKFPTPHNLLFLLRYWSSTGNETALGIVRRTLDAMHRGGIYDHIGFGFSRYSTDEKWLVPHFEKMLYDNALLAIAYLETYHATKENEYKKVAEEIFTYVLRDMRSPEGGFYSAEDADSEGVEGKYYVFTPEEIVEVLGEESGSAYCSFYDITAEGNFEGSNIPNLIKATIPEEELLFVEECRQKLFDAREKRIHPHRDDKILTGWNSMMIAALAIGGRILKEDKYTRAAETCMDFMIKNLVRKDNRLLARFREGEAAYLAYAQDYAYFIWALLEMYETTFQSQYLFKAMIFTEDMIKYFWDKNQGGFYLYGEDGEELLTRPKEIYDGAVPSSNSVMSWNLIRISRITGRQEYEDYATMILNLFGREIDQHPTAYAFSLIGLSYLKAKSIEIVVVDNDGENRDAAARIKHIVNQSYKPFHTMVYMEENDSRLKNLIVSGSEYRTINGRPTIYLCQDHTCREPTTDFYQLEQVYQ